MARQPATEAPLIAHVVFDLSTGGLENGLINLLNHMPVGTFRHAIICITGKAPAFPRIKREDVQLLLLDKQPGYGPGVHWRMWRALRRLRPDIVHTRNIAALEMQFAAWLAGTPARVHSEHGREGRDSTGNYRPYNIIRRILSVFVQRYLAMSDDIAQWLVRVIGIGRGRVSRIYSGVDIVRFVPRSGPRSQPGNEAFFRDAQFVVGAVGRMAQIKNQALLVRAMARLRDLAPAEFPGARLVVVGDGPERAACERLARELAIEESCWFAGERRDIPQCLNCFDVFCLTSHNEGINNTLLEAMAAGLPVVATRVGGNPELVENDVGGLLVPDDDAEALALALLGYLRDPELRRRHGLRSRARAEQNFSMEAMVTGYVSFYRGALARRQGAAAGGMTMESR